MNESQKKGGVGPKEKAEVERLEREVRKQRKLQDDSRAQSKKVRGRLQQLKHEVRGMWFECTFVSRGGTYVNSQLIGLYFLFFAVMCNRQGS